LLRGGDASEPETRILLAMNGLATAAVKLGLAVYRQRLSSSGPTGMGAHTSTEPETGVAVVAPAEAVPTPRAPADSTNAATVSERIILEFIQGSSVVLCDAPRGGASR
jgi:hypothetical protein